MSIYSVDSQEGHGGNVRVAGLADTLDCSLRSLAEDSLGVGSW
jgi:hypothetical protein